MITLALTVFLTAAPADVVQQLDVRASPSDVWKAWTTAAGAKTFFAPDARIEPKPGGAYELGAQDGKVLTLEPQKKLVLSWNFPPSMQALRDAKANTTVTIELLPQGKTTRVRLTQTGWKDEPAWHEARAWFDREWHRVLLRLAHRYRRAPIDWSNPWGPTPLSTFRFMEGNFVSADGSEVENWSSRNAGLLGASSATDNGKPVFYELATIEPDDGEWLLSLRMFKTGLSSHPKTEKEAARLVADALDKDHAVFVSEFGDPVRVEYSLDREGLTVRVKTPDRDETHVFKRVLK